MGDGVERGPRKGAESSAGLSRSARARAALRRMALSGDQAEAISPKRKASRGFEAALKRSRVVRKKAPKMSRGFEAALGRARVKAKRSVAPRPKRVTRAPLRPKTRPAEVVKETFRHKETVEWNKRVIPTFDDGPVVDFLGRGGVDDVTLDVMKASYEKGVNNLELYWLGANMLKPRVLRSMGLKEHRGVPRVGRRSKVRPGHWMKWVDNNRGAQSRKAFIKSLLNPRVVELCKRMKALLPPGQDISDLIGFHGITHEASTSGKHVSQLSPTEIVDEIVFFQEIIRAAFDEPGYRVKKGRTPYGSGMKFDISNPAKKHEGRYRRLRAAAKRVNPDFQWNAWHADAEDWTNDGRFSVDKVGRQVSKNVRGGRTGYILMHERYYTGGAGRIASLYDDLERRTTPRRVAARPRTRNVERSPDGVKIKLELGRWTKAEINKMLAKAQRHPTASARVSYIVDRLKGTPFHYESQLPILPKGHLRIRLKTFDCVTFIYYVTALASAKNFDEFVMNFRRLRYKDTETEGVDNNTDSGNIYDFAYNSLYVNAVERGLLRVVTDEVANGYGSTISTTLKAVKRTPKRDKARNTVRPKINEGRRVYASIITPSAYSKIDKSAIKDGDIILFTRGSGGVTIVGHVAVVEKRGGEIYFVHASAGTGVANKGKRIDKYIDGIKRFKGFVVLRPQNYDASRNDQIANI